MTCFAIHPRYPWLIASSDGRVFSHVGEVGTGKPSARGYLTVTPRKGINPVLKHRIIYEAFHGELPKLVRHWNDDPLDNRLSNLLSGDKASNYADALRNGKACVGEKHPKAELDEDAVIEIRRRYDAGEDCASIARDLGFKRQTVYTAATRRSWKHVKSPDPTFPVLDMTLRRVRPKDSYSLTV